MRVIGKLIAESPHVIRLTVSLNRNSTNEMLKTLRFCVSFDKKVKYVTTRYKIPLNDWKSNEVSTEDFPHATRNPLVNAYIVEGAERFKEIVLASGEEATLNSICSEFLNYLKQQEEIN